MSRRESKKLATRDAIVSEATRLMYESGYHAVSVEDIAAAANVSRRTFFRYFPAKEDVLFPDAENRFRRFRNALRSAPTSVPAFTALRLILAQMAMDMSERASADRMRDAISDRTPELYARQAKWADAFAEELARFLKARLPKKPEHQRRAEYIAGAVSGATQVAMRRWLRETSSNKLKSTPEARSEELLASLAPLFADLRVPGDEA